MSKAFENVISKVVGEVRQEVEAMFKDSLRLSLEILEATKRETVVEAEKMYESMERKAKTLRLRILGSTELVIRSKSLVLVEQMMNEIFQKAFGKIEEIAPSDRYKASMKRLLEEGIDAVASKDLVVSCNERDSRFLKAVAEEVANERGVNVKVAEEPIESIGGVQVRSSDGIIFYDNTIEARMERLKPLLRKDLVLLSMGKE